MTKHNTFIYSELGFNLFANSKQYPDKTAILEVESGQRFSYRELARRSIEHALGLKQSGYRSGDKIFILTPASFELVAFIYGCALAGVIPVFADPAMGRDIMMSRIDQIDPNCILVPKIVKNLVAVKGFKIARSILNFELPDLFLLDFSMLKSIPDFQMSDSVEYNAYIEEYISSVSSETAEGKKECLDRDRDFVIVFTSGTTSKPKGVVHSEQSISSMCNRLEQLVSTQNLTTLFSDQPYITFPGINLGLTVAISARPVKENMTKLLKYLARFEISAFFTNPHVFNKLLDQLTANNKQLPQSLVAIYLGSAPIYKELLAKARRTITHPQLELYCNYGMTEILPVATTNWQDKLHKDSSKGDFLGKIFADIDYKIAADGELLITGDIFKNYFGEQPAEYFATGDIVEIDEQRQLYMKSRKKDMIITASYNIYPQLFESTIRKIPGISDAAIVGYFNQKIADEEVVLFVVLEDVKRTTKSETEIRLKILSQLKSGKYSIDLYAQPKHLFFIDELPVKGRSNKPDKLALRAMAIKLIETKIS